MKIFKNVEPTLDKLLDLVRPSNYLIEIKGHHLDKNIFEVTKDNGEFKFESDSEIPKGVQLHKELEFNRDDIIKFSKPDLDLFVLGKNIFVNEISYNRDFSRKIFIGQHKNTRSYLVGGDGEGGVAGGGDGSGVDVGGVLEEHLPHVHVAPRGRLHQWGQPYWETVDS